MLAALSNSDLSLIVVLIGIACLGGAAYLAWLRNVAGAVLMLVVAIVCFLIAD